PGAPTRRPQRRFPGCRRLPENVVPASVDLLYPCLSLNKFKVQPRCTCGGTTTVSAEQRGDGGEGLSRPYQPRYDARVPKTQMSLTVGARFGAFEVTGRLGEGGMGEVYRARDTKLGRDVALKILPPAVAMEPDRIARFKREAQVLASLNRPTIAAIYGFEESHGIQALILELVDGTTLAER